MSNYLIVVHDSSATGLLTNWLDTSHTPTSERFTAKLNRRRSITVVSKDVEDSIHGGTFFRGTAMSPEHRAIAFGVDGWVKMPRNVDEHGVAGEFILAEWGRREVRIRHDVFGSVAMMHAHGPGFIAVSDSMLLLDDLRQRFGLQSTQNDEVLLARSILNGHATQQMSPETIIREITWVPAAQGLKIDVGDTMILRVDGRSMTDRVVDQRTDYVSSLRAGAAFVASSTSALAQVQGWRKELMLSGGYDSRAILAAALRTGTTRELSLSVKNRVPAEAKDSEAALAIGERFGLPINQPTDRSRVIDYNMNPLTIWASSVLSVYDRLVPDISRRTDSKEFSFTGLGGEVLKGNWGWTNADAISSSFENLHPDRVDAFRSQLNKGLQAVGAEPDWRDASELQYLGYRNGIHGAGHIAMSMTGVRPLQQVQFAAVAHTRIDADAPARVNRDAASFHGGNAAMGDVLAVLHPELAALPYDSPGKALPPEHVTARLHALGGPLTDGEIRSVAVLGDPARVPYGPSVLGDEVAKRRGFDIVRGPDEILALTDRGIDSLRNEAVRDTYREIAENARWKMVTKQLPPPHAGSSPSKALSLAIFAS